MRVQALRDEAIASDIRAVLSHHQALSDCQIDFHVDGGVAHVRGEVRDVQERERLRETIYRVRGVHAVWDVLRTPQQHEVRIIDIGCGNHKQIASAVGVDYHRHPSVDVVAHIERGLPFETASVDHVYAIHFLEHVQDLLGVMNEIHRVLKGGGILHVMVPNWQFVNAVADPTHVRFFHPQTFKFFCRPYPGLRQFRPLSIAAACADLFADLRPIKDGEVANDEQTLARFFD